jgi:hypothetical protein
MNDFSQMLKGSRTSCSNNKGTKFLRSVKLSGEETRNALMETVDEMHLLKHTHGLLTLYWNKRRAILFSEECYSAIEKKRGVSISNLLLGFWFCIFLVFQIEHVS